MEEVNGITFLFSCLKQASGASQFVRVASFAAVSDLLTRLAFLVLISSVL